MWITLNKHKCKTCPQVINSCGQLNIKIDLSIRGKQINDIKKL